MCKFYPARMLIQCRRRGAHSDIWLWPLVGSTLTSPEYTSKQRIRQLSDVAPVKPVQWWPGSGSPMLEMIIPIHAHTLMAEEYGDDYMTPIVTRWECTEMIVKGIALRSRAMQWVNAGALFAFSVTEVLTSPPSAYFEGVAKRFNFCTAPPSNG